MRQSEHNANLALDPDAVRVFVTHLPVNNAWGVLLGRPSRPREAFVLRIFTDRRDADWYVAGLPA